MNRKRGMRTVPVRLSDNMLNLIEGVAGKSMFPENRSEYIRNAVRMRIEGELSHLPHAVRKDLLK